MEPKRPTGAPNCSNEWRAPEDNEARDTHEHCTKERQLEQDNRAFPIPWINLHNESRRSRIEFASVPFYVE